MTLEGIEEELRTLRGSHLHRQLSTIESPQDVVVKVGGKEYVNLSSNNYLGFCNCTRLKEASLRFLTRYGTGTGASRLISGTMDVHEELERLTARFKGAEAALVFSTGYMANTGVMQALAGREDGVYSDELNHASLVDGCRLSRAEIHVYRHRDTAHLRELLEKAGDGHRRRIVVTESVFSMDGDIAPLPEISRIARDHGALLLVDDAHATGVLGERGRGSLEHFKMEAGEEVIQSGTYSKALGSFGAYVASPRTVRDYLVNAARSFIYTTSLPPAVIGASIAAIEEIEADGSHLARLRENTSYFRRCLDEMGYGVGDCGTPIVPIVTGSVERTVEFSRRLREGGVWAVPIRPPTVPAGRSRIRLSITAAHGKEHMDHCLDALGRVGRELGLL